MDHSEKLKLYGFNNLTKALSFNIYDVCYAKTPREQKDYIAYIDQQYNSERLTRILTSVSYTHLICLAVSPPLKSYGVPGRPRLFEVIQRIREVNEERRRRALGRQFRDKSWRNDELKADPSLAVSYLVAPPRMAHYMKSVSYTHLDVYKRQLPDHP